MGGGRGHKRVARGGPRDGIALCLDRHATEFHGAEHVCMHARVRVQMHAHPSECPSSGGVWVRLTARTKCWSAGGDTCILATKASPLGEASSVYIICLQMLQTHNCIKTKKFFFLKKKKEKYGGGGPSIALAEGNACSPKRSPGLALGGCFTAGVGGGRVRAETEAASPSPSLPPVSRSRHLPCGCRGQPNETISRLSSFNLQVWLPGLKIKF